MAAHVSIDLSDVRKLHRDLEAFAHRALPYAARNGINAGAFAGRKEWLVQQDRSFILRNKYVARSTQVTKATGMNVAHMAAFLGNLAPFMGKAERGGIERGKGGGSKPIPTNVAAGQGMSSGPRTKTVRKANWLSAIKFGKRGKAGNRKQRNAIAIRQAVAAGQRFTFLELENRKGLFRITGGKKRVNVRMVWDLSHRSVRVPASHTLERTLKAIEPRMAIIHRDAIVEQLRRNHVLGY